MNDLRERQEAEAEAMASIFHPDFHFLPPTWQTQPLQYKIRVVPPPGATDNVYSSIWLIIR